MDGKLPGSIQESGASAKPETGLSTDEIIGVPVESEAVAAADTAVDRGANPAAKTPEELLREPPKKDPWGEVGLFP